jgi:predicted O-methyltransferase YrrM
MNDLSAVEYEMLSYCEKLGGQTSSIELVALYRITQSLPENARILEIGSYRGRSAAAFGFAIKNTSKKLYCLDIWRNYNTQDDNPRKGDLVQDPLELTDLAVFEDFLKKTELFGDSICHLRGKNSDFKDIFAEDSFNMVFIDGAHDYDNVCFDIDTALMILKPGSIICGHDYHSAGIGVKKAVNEKIFDNPEIKSDGIIPETSIWIAILE